MNVDKGLWILAEAPGMIVLRNDRSAVWTVFFIVWGAGFSMCVMVPFAAQATDGFWSMVKAVVLAVIFGCIGVPVFLLSLRTLFCEMRRTITVRAGSDHIEERVSGLTSRRTRKLDAKGARAIVTEETILQETGPDVVVAELHLLNTDNAWKPRCLGNSMPFDAYRLRDRINAILANEGATAPTAP